MDKNHRLFWADHVPVDSIVKNKIEWRMKMFSGLELDLNDDFKTDALSAAIPEWEHQSHRTYYHSSGRRRVKFDGAGNCLFYFLDFKGVWSLSLNNEDSNLKDFPNITLVISSHHPRYFFGQYLTGKLTLAEIKSRIREKAFSGSIYGTIEKEEIMLKFDAKKGNATLPPPKCKLVLSANGDQLVNNRHNPHTQFSHLETDK